MRSNLLKLSQKITVVAIAESSDNQQSVGGVDQNNPNPSTNATNANSNNNSNYSGGSNFVPTTMTRMRSG